VLGVIMIFFGVVLQYFGRKVQKSFMKFAVGFTTFIFVCAVCFKLNWFAMLDPTEPEESKSAFLTFLTFLLAGIASYIMLWAFK
jgi:hypothetical protein